MLSKRGQVTTFIIFGILVVAVIAGIIYTNQVILKKQREIEVAKEVALPLEIEKVRDYVKSCIEDTGPTGLYMIGLQGGYIIVPGRAKTLATNYTVIAYGYYNGEKTLPSLAIIQKGFSDYMEVFLPLCVDFKQFPKLNITADNVNARTTVKENSVTSELYYPLTIKSDGAVYELKDKYSVDFPIRFGKIYSAAEGIVEKEIKEPDFIDLTYLLDTELDVSILPFDDNTIVYSITDKESSINNIEYTFLFANRFEQ